jgi:hypothetical protein
MDFDLRIRERISLYLSGRSTDADLESWLSEAAWEIDDESPATQRLANSALRLISEATHGDWSQNQLKAQLQALLKIPRDSSSSVLPSVVAGGGEELLGKFSMAQRDAESRDIELDDEEAAQALMGYAYLSTPRWFGSGQSSDPAFRRQSRGESDTPAPAEEELAIS